MCSNWENSFSPSLRPLSVHLSPPLSPSISPPLLVFLHTLEMICRYIFYPCTYQCLFPQNAFGVWDHREKCWKAGFEHWWNPNPQTVFKFASCPRNDGAPFCLQSSLLCNYFSGTLCFLTLALPHGMARSLGFSGPTALERHFWVFLLMAVCPITSDVFHHTSARVFYIKITVFLQGLTVYEIFVLNILFSNKIHSLVLGSFGDL